MLYRFLQLLVRITIKVFFRKIEVRNKGLIPSAGPLIICANHPGTFMDPMVIAAQLNRPVFFLAKGVIFKSKFAQFLLPKLNMIPVYRQQDDPSQLGKNDDTFVKCHEHLERGGVILIFPEGISLTERKLKTIKTGAARIALGAEAKNNFSLGVKIITIGLNYQNPHKFNQDLFINIDEPIPLSEFKERYAADTFKAAHALTDRIRGQLEKIIIDIEDENTDELVKKIEEVYKPKLLKEPGVIAEKQHGDFSITKNIVETVMHFKATDAARVQRVESKVNRYYTNLMRVGLSDEQLTNKEVKHSLFLNNVKSISFILVGFPFYIFGLITTFLPFEIPSLLAKRIVSSKEYEGPVAMAFGIITFSLFYTLETVAIWKYTHDLLLTIFFLFCLPAAGLFAYYYWHTVDEIRSGWKLINLFYKRSSLIADLILQRKEIIAEFDNAREEWLRLTSSPLPVKTT